MQIVSGWIWLSLGLGLVVLVLVAMFRKRSKGITFDHSLNEAKSNPRAKIILEKDLEVLIDLYANLAPNHVAGFIKLVESGYYNGLVFHRVVPDFVVQTGCPKGDGTGGPGYSLDAEFSDKPHLSGTVAMARTADPNSAGSQFYICLAPQPSLDRQYTVFGQVTEGFEAIQAVEKGDVIREIKILS